MKFTDIYEQTINFWPQSICIADGEVREDDGGYFPALSKIWRDVEAETESENAWVQLMVWSIFCGYHKQAMDHLKAGKMVCFRQA